MKPHIVLSWLAALAAITVYAQESPQQLLAAIPQCSLSCMITEIPKSGCSFTNTTCLCGASLNTPALTSCILASCNNTEAIKLSRAQVGFCGLVSDKSRQTRNLVTLLVLLGVCAIFIAVRVWVRIKPIFRFWIDDWLILAAFLCLCAYTVVVILQVKAKFAEHIWFLSDDDITRQTYLSYISSPIIAAGPAFVKLSLLTFLLRIFPHQKFIIACKIMIGFVLTNSLAMVLVSIFQCVPVSLNWESWRYTTQSPSCVNLQAFALAGSIMYTIQDFIILIMPIHAFLKLKLSLSKRIKLVFLFSAGLIATIFAFMRFPAFLKMISTMAQDPFWDSANILLYNILEISFGIICACLPATNALLSHHFPTVFGSETETRSSEKQRDGQAAKDTNRANAKAKSPSMHVEVGSLDRLSSKGLVTVMEADEC